MQSAAGQGHPPARDRPHGQYDQHPQHDQYDQQYNQYGDYGSRRAINSRDGEHGPDEYYRSRHGYTASPPPRNTLSYDDLPEEEPRHGHTRSYHGYPDDHDRAGREYGRPRDLSRDGSRPRGYDRRDDPDGDYDARGGRGRSYRDHYDDPHYRQRSESYSDHEHHRGRRSRSYSRSPSRHPGNPSDTVILEGLPGDVSISELQSALMNSPALVEEGFIDIRIPATSGQRRAFVQFHTTDDAITFVDKHFPKIVMDGLTPHGEPSGGKVPLFVHFARSSREQRDEGDRRNQGSADSWVCPSCDFSNYATRPRCKMCGYTQSSTGATALHALTGEADASNDPSQFLVIYPLDPCVTEEVLEFGVKKLELVEKQQQPPSKDGGPRPLKSTAPTGDATGYGARRGSLHRVFLVRDKASGQSLKYGFAEFWTLEDAAAALHKYRMHKAFTIGGTPVAVSSIHMGVFVPELQHQPGPSGGKDKFSFVPLFNPALRVKYRDPRVYANQRVVNAEMPGKQATTGVSAREGASGSEAAKKTKKRKAEAALDTSAAKKPVAMAGQMALWQKKHQEIHKDGAAASGQGNDNGGGGLAGSDRATPESHPSARSGTSSADKAGPIRISLGGMAKAVATAENSDVHRSTGGDSGAAAPGTDAQPVVSFVDRERVCCLLCMMKYKSLEDLGIHERSGNHKKAMADENKVKAAMPRLAARDKRLGEKEGAGAPGADVTEEEKSQYRDRAKERREVYNQPEKPTPSHSSKAAGKPKHKPETAAKKPAEDKTAAPAPGAPSKGSAMLAKMGWKGQGGLGAKGDGRTEIVGVEAYQEGVGLGVEGAKLGDAGKLAEMRTKGDYGEYVVAAQEKARERYSRLS